MAGQCIRNHELSAQPLILWEPIGCVYTQSKVNRSRQRLNYVDM